jgi:pyrimidine-nucleoside phosphorylase
MACCYYLELKRKSIYGIKGSMRVYDIILKKRNRLVHTYEEIEHVVNGYTKGDIPDYQVSSWLMACFLNGLNGDETFYLTKAMLLSGKSIDLGFIEKPKIDKHSTGGVGDKISLILAPAVAACGIIVPMMSGRGLGFSGGTLDKLESIPGFRVHLSEEELFAVLKEVGYVMIGQSEDIAPADKKLYALRDVTATVESIPLITSSILSKKLAEGVDAVIMDVKFGSGAFMKKKDDAISLARSLVSTAGRLNKKLICVLSNMNQPLGRAVGNALEVEESVSTLKGEGEEDVVELTSVLGGYMLMAAGSVDNLDQGKAQIVEKIKNGEAYEKFKQSVRVQGGDVEAVIDTERLPGTRYSEDVLSRESGYIYAIFTEDIGTASVFLGAGRFTKEDSIDPGAGIIIKKKIGDYVAKGDVLATMRYNDSSHIKNAYALIQNAYRIERKKGGAFILVHETVQ